MKNRILLFTLSFALLMACDKTDELIFDPVNGQTGVSFATQLQSVSVPEEGITVDIPVEVTTVSNQDRSFTVVVDSEVTTANPEDYSLSSVVVPAGSHVGNLAVTLNYDTLEDFVSNTLKIDFSLDGDAVVVRNASTQINFIREFVCPDLVLNIIFDSYPGETSWEITDAGGDIVASGGDYGGETSYTEELCLIDGDYTFTIFDAFGDGICCAWGNGSYEMTLDGAVLFSGASFGDSESQNFTVN